MNKIGSGVQYNVYDIGSGRVRKIKTSFFQKIHTFHLIAPKYNIYFHPIFNIKTTIGAGKLTKQSVNDLVNHLKDIDLSIIGNPTIQDDYNYEQDKVLPLGDQLNSSNFTQQKELIDGYIDNILSCWDYGFSDTVFNFNINCGVTQTGKVILIDLGELTWSKDEVAELVSQKNWEKRSSFSRLKNTELKNYIRGQFDNNITISNLNSHWKSKVV